MNQQIYVWDIRLINNGKLCGDGAFRGIIYVLCIIYCGFNVNDRGMVNHKREFVWKFGRPWWTQLLIDQQHYLKFSLFLYNHSVNEVFDVLLHEKAQFNSLWFSVDNVVLKMVFELSQMFVFGTTQDIAALIWHTQTVHQLKFVFKATRNIYIYKFYCQQEITTQYIFSYINMFV